MVWFGLFNGISTSYGLFNTKILFIYKYYIIMNPISALNYQLKVGAPLKQYNQTTNQLLHHTRCTNFFKEEL